MSERPEHAGTASEPVLPPQPASTSLTPARQRLLALRRQQRDAGLGGETRPILPRQAPGPIPCAPSQEAMWLIERLSEQTGAYNSAQAVRISGALDRMALGRALNALVDRHEALRTAIVAHDGVPQQEVLPHVDVPLLHVHSHDLGGHGLEAALLHRLSEAVQQPIDLTQAPLLRASLWQLDAGANTHAPRLTEGQEPSRSHEQVLLLVIHHIVTDGWSMGVIARDLAALYAGFTDASTQEGARLAPLSLQFADWASWQRQRLRGEALDSLLRHWRARLAGLTPLLLPTDHKRTAQPSSVGQSLHFAWPAVQLNALHDLARGQQVTLFMLLLAAFKVLLLRYTQHSDIAVGSPVAGRDRPEFEPLVGCFVNTVVLRTDLSGNPTFTELLARVRQTALEAYSHQALPFETLVADLSPVREAGRNPFYEVSFALDNQPAPAYAFGTAHAELMRLPATVAKFDLSLGFAETAEGLRGSIHYRSELFDAATIDRLCTHLQTIVTQVLRDPHQGIEQVPMLSPAEHTLLDDWNRTAQPFDPGVPAHVLLQAQAHRTPAAIAVDADGVQLSYLELNARANRLAHHLRGLGVMPNEAVGVCMDHSAEWVVAMLAVLKAGGAYLPLDPAQPQARLAFQVRDTGAAVILAQPHRVTLATALITPPAQSEGQVLSIDLAVDWTGLGPDQEPTGRAAPTDTAYIIYTSGSTGQPKGVPIPNQGMATLAHALRLTLGLSTDDRFLLRSSIGFDASILEFVAALQAGAALVVPGTGVYRDMAAVARTVRDHAVTVLQAVPSALSVLVDDPVLAECANLRLLLASGEALAPELVDRIRRRLPGLDIRNFYGPTETSCVSHHFEVPAHWPTGVPIPIGRSLPNVQSFILDARLQRVPIGIIGELFIGGPGLASGYLNRPELSAERFIEHPDAPGQRLYRTGDLARWRAQGDIEYLGRDDFQVKIRGFRIELGEIEAALRTQPGIQDCAVLAREDEPGDLRLVAYLALAANAVPVDTTGLRRALSASLPDYMVPSAFVTLPQLPSLPNGKLDRSALPKPGPVSLAPQVGASPAPALSPTQALIQRVWQDILPAVRIGIDDNFFDLGGHSLMAMRAVSRLGVQLSGEIPLRWLFDRPTVAGLAAKIDEAGTARTCAPPVVALPRVRAPRDQPLPVLYSQRSIWLAQATNPQTIAYNMTVARRLSGPLEVDCLIEALDWVVQRHEAFRTRFVRVDGEVMQSISPAQRPVVTQTDLRHLPSDQRWAQVHRLRNEMAAQPFDLSVPGLYRISLLHTSDDEHLLLWIIHHAISDHSSNDILWRELGHAYSARLAKQRPSLPPPVIDVADLAVWQGMREHAGAWADSLVYWQRHLQGLEPLALPHDLDLPGPPSGCGDSVTVALSGALMAGVQRTSLAQGATPFMFLLASFAWLLSRYAATEDFAIGVPVAQRNHPDLEQLVGALVQTLVLRCDLVDNPAFGEQLARMRTTLLDALAHQDVPLERISRATGAARSGARGPIVQVLFNLIETDPETGAFEGLQASPVPFDVMGAQFELALSVDSQLGEARLAFASDLFVRSTAQRILANWLALLEQLVADPTCRLDDTRSASAAERVVLKSWNETIRHFDPPHTLGPFLSQGLASKAARQALTAGGERLSHADLQAKVWQLCRTLRSRGAARGVRIGLCLPRTSDLLVAQLAVLHSGAAYVPLDPAYPGERLRFMAQDAGLALLVGGVALPQGLADMTVPALLLGADAALIAEQPCTPIPPDSERDAQAEDHAYIIYTSGSTGQPKGVAVPHRAVVNFLASMAREPGLHADDVLVAVTTLSFDIAVLELLLPLSVGAHVVLASREQAQDGRALRELLTSSGATVMQATPTTWRLLIDAAWKPPQGFKALIGGEPLSADLAQLLIDRLGVDGELWNLYGPTETTVWSTCARVVQPDEGIRIGRPIANTQVHVLDAASQPCPIGVAGEIVIGGLGVSLGYFGRPDLTAERFRAHPAIDATGTCLYHTGDRGRWCHDGALEHLGRLDAQLKVRGYRIEPGEVEAALTGHPEVAQAVVLAREDRPGDVRLVAYVVAKRKPPTSSAPTLSTLIDHLRARLPAHMVPSHVVVLDAVPRLPNGKLDRQSLPPPDAAELATDAAPAETSLEQTLTEIWCRHLGTKSIGMHDDFFDLGGHSLVAIRVLAEVERILGREVPVTTLFQAPTIRKLAAALGELKHGRISCAVLLQPSGCHTPLFAVSGYGGGITPFRPLSLALGGDQPVCVLDTSVFGDWRGLKTLEELAQEMIVDMRRVQSVGPYLLIGYSLGGKIAYEMAQQLRRTGQAVALLAMLDCASPGYPRKAALPLRVLAHVRHARRMGGIDAWHYLRDRLTNSRRQVMAMAMRRRVFADDGDAALAPARAMQRAAEVVGKAWIEYRPAPYEGSILLVRAGVRASHPGIIDDDPEMGWGPLVKGGIQQADMACEHVRMLQPEHAAELAALLAPHLIAVATQVEPG